MAKADRIIGVLLLLLAGAYYWATYDIAVGLASDVLGPTFFPRLLAILLGVASAGLVVRTWWTKASDLPPAGDRPDRLIGALVLTVAYLLLLPQAGYLLLTPLYLAAFALLLGYRALLPLVGTALGITVTLYVVFGRFLRVRLPAGTLFE